MDSCKTILPICLSDQDALAIDDDVFLLFASMLFSYVFVRSWNGNDLYCDDSVAMSCVVLKSEMPHSDCFNLSLKMKM